MNPISFGGILIISVTAAFMFMAFVAKNVEKWLKENTDMTNSETAYVTVIITMTLVGLIMVVVGIIVWPK